MGLFRTASKVAVASSVHGKVQRRQANRWAQDNQAREQAAAAQAAAAAAPPPPPAVHHAPAQPADAHTGQQGQQPQRSSAPRAQQ